MHDYLWQEVTMSTTLITIFVNADNFPSNFRRDSQMPSLFPKDELKSPT